MAKMKHKSRQWIAFLGLLLFLAFIVPVQAPRNLENDTTRAYAGTQTAGVFAELQHIRDMLHPPQVTAREAKLIPGLIVLPTHLEAASKLTKSGATFRDTQSFPKLVKSGGEVSNPNSALTKDQQAAVVGRTDTNQVRDGYIIIEWGKFYDTPGADLIEYEIGKNEGGQIWVGTENADLNVSPDSTGNPQASGWTHIPALIPPYKGCENPPPGSPDAPTIPKAVNACFTGESNLINIGGEDGASYRYIYFWSEGSPAGEGGSDVDYLDVVCRETPNCDDCVKKQDGSACDCNQECKNSICREGRCQSNAMPRSNTAPGSNAITNQEACGNSICNPGETPENCPEDCSAVGDNAWFITHTAPSQMMPGETQTVSITMKNTGTTVWVPGSYFLAPVNTNDLFSRVLPQVPVTENVPPATDHTFTFSITTPREGVYNVQWQMVKQDGWTGNVPGTYADEKVFNAFQAAEGNPSQPADKFITNLYTTIFDRGPDTEGMKFWLEQLKTGTPRYEVYKAFLTSKEYEENPGNIPQIHQEVDPCTGQNTTDEIKIFIARMFWIHLNRAADCPGFDNWVEQTESRFGETTSLVPITVSTTSCGNKVCDTGETPENCPQDCSPQELKTCAEYGGEICPSHKYCPDQVLEASDTKFCCNTQCVAPEQACDACGGFLKSCSRHACYAIPEHCYWTNGLFGNDCNACKGHFPDSCYLYHDEQSCKDNPCKFLQCQWDGSQCVFTYEGESCDDGLPNGKETDIDCGGPNCKPCSLAQRCRKDNDCKSQNCQGGFCALPLILEPSHCLNNVLDQDETDVDCGGMDCSERCLIGQKCTAGTDCLTKNCEEGKCVLPVFCGDGVCNGDETIDTCPQDCEKPTRCKDCGRGFFNLCDEEECYSMPESCYYYSSFGEGMCLSCSLVKTCEDFPEKTSCTAHHCLPDTPCVWNGKMCLQGSDCHNGIRDGDELDVDCGGNCPPCPNTTTPFGLKHIDGLSYQNGRWTVIAGDQYWVYNSPAGEQK